MKRFSIWLAGAVLVTLLSVEARADVVAFNPSQDAEIMQSGTSTLINNLNYGNSEWLTVNWGKPGGPTATQFPKTGNSFGLFQFDLTSLPAGCTIDSAVLTLYSESYASNPACWPSTLYPITSAWDEATVTYNTRPTRETSGIALGPYNVFPGGLPGYFTYDLTSIAQGWLEGTVANYGLMTTDTHYATSGRYVARLYSSETLTDYAPRLDLTYTDTEVYAPEPSSMALALAGLLPLAGKLRKRFRK